MINVDFFADNVGFEWDTELSVQANNVLEYICDNGKCTSNDLLRYCDSDEALFDDIINELISYGYLVYEGNGYHVKKPKHTDRR